MIVPYTVRTPDNKGSNIMKNYKTLVALLLAAVIALSFAACKGTPSSPEETSGEEIAVVTDESGETVTDKEGEPVTEKSKKKEKEKVTVDVSEQESKADEQSTEKKKDKTTEKETTTQPVSKVKNPNTVKEINITDITEESLTLKWEGVVCDYYELEYKRATAEEWESIDDKLKATSIDIEGLVSMTKYDFRLRAIIKNKAGGSPSAWTYASAKTKEKIETRKIKISVQLPARNEEEDRLIVYIKEDGKKRKKIYSKKVKFDGSKVTFETEKEYKGVVTITAKLKNAEVQDKIKTDKDKCTLDVTAIGMDIINGEDD